MAMRRLLKNEIDRPPPPDGGATDTRVIVLWVVASLILVALFLLALQCWRRHRIAKRAKLARQDAILNMPIAVPWEVSTVPYAEVVDVPATAPDYDELFPATEPAILPPRR